VRELETELQIHRAWGDLGISDIFLTFETIKNAKQHLDLT